MDKDFETASMETPSSRKSLVKEACSSVLTPEEERFLHMIHDPETYYMEKVYNQNLKIIVDCNEAMTLSNMSLFTPYDVL
jgi:hypothetical protein